MITLQMSKVHSIKTENQGIYRGIANDGCNFYLTIPQCCEVHKYDFCLEHKEIIHTYRGYKSLCYDEKFKCFWAIGNKVNNKIFKLDMCFREKGCILVVNNESTVIGITGVSCKCKDDKLLISYNDGIGVVDKCSNSTIKQIHKCTSGKINSVESLNKCYILSKIKNSNCVLGIYSYDNEQKLQCCMPDEYVVEDMSYVCSKKENIIMPSEFYILATKSQKCSFIIKCCIMQRYDDACECIEEVKCDSWIPSHTQCDKEINCKKALCDILESIALMETSISHILNAEGEKIQRGVCMSKEPCDLLRVNESVNKTIVNITQLEQILYSKLQLTKEMKPDIFK